MPCCDVRFTYFFPFAAFHPRQVSVYKTTAGLITQSVFNASGGSASDAAVSVSFSYVDTGPHNGGLSVLLASWAESPYPSLKSNVTLASSVVDVRVVTEQPSVNATNSNASAAELTSFPKPVEIWHTLR